MQHNEDLDALEGRIGYRFKDRSLLRCALTHTSYANEQKLRRAPDYERLEFLGDAILEMVTSAVLYREYPDKKEGEMTKLRSTLVCEPALAYCARDIGLEEFIRLGRGEEAGGGRHKDSIISDVMEAVIGAMYLDCGRLDEPQSFIMRFILSDLRDKQLFYDAKSILQEQLQHEGADVAYEVLEESGPGHCRHFRVAVRIGGKEAATGEGRSKKAAEQQAAYHVLRQRQEQEEAAK